MRSFGGLYSDFSGVMGGLVKPIILGLSESFVGEGILFFQSGHSSHALWFCTRLHDFLWLIPAPPFCSFLQFLFYYLDHASEI